jgi:hypothetical protein
MYTGYELTVTCFCVLDLVTKPIFPFTVLATATDLVDVGTRRGSHSVRHVLVVQCSFAPLSIERE